MADVAFVAAGKYPDGRPPRKADETQPDFVAEVISPDDTATMVQEKVRDWLSTDLRLLWLVYPETNQVVVYHADGSAQTVDHDGVLDGGDVFPGLQLPVRCLPGVTADGSIGLRGALRALSQAQTHGHPSDHAEQQAVPAKRFIVLSARLLRCNSFAEVRPGDSVTQAIAC